MSHSTLLPSLSLGTLVIGLVIIAGLAIWFFRKRSNRKPMAGRRERNVAADLNRGNSAPEHLPPE